MSYEIEKHWKHCGYDCVAVATDMGHRCGYVGIPESHYLFGVDYGDEKTLDIVVHGGLTFASGGKYPLEFDYRVWWFGFDCGHYGDAKDKSLIKDKSWLKYAELFDHEGTVKTLTYVIGHCNSLAEQLYGLGEKHCDSKESE